VEDLQGPQTAVNQDGEKGRQLCSRIASGLNVPPRVDDELKRFQCKIISVTNYDEFEKWLDELLAEL
jgi:hypothetical protein